MLNNNTKVRRRGGQIIEEEKVVVVEHTTTTICHLTFFFSQYVVVVHITAALCDKKISIYSTIETNINNYGSIVGKKIVYYLLRTGNVNMCTS